MSAKVTHDLLSVGKPKTDLGKISGKNHSKRYVKPMQEFDRSITEISSKVN